MPRPAATNRSTSAPPRRTLNPRALLVLLAFIALVALLAAPGSGSPVFATVTVLATLLSSGALALLWLLGAMGLGRLGARMIRPIAHTPTRLALQLSLGLALALFLAHLLGALGLMSRWIAWTPTLGGLALLLHQARAWRAAAPPLPRTHPRLPALAFLALIPLALLAVAASIPPGTLWESEGRAYDVLSYHLMLPREWIGRGRIVPLDHNVYSFLPSALESAYTQLAVMLGCGAGPRPPLGLGDGLPIHAASFLHALLALASALTLVPLASTLLEPRALARGPSHAHGLPPVGPRPLPATTVLAPLTFLSIPWVLVTASLPYNEMALTLFLAAALLVALEPSLTPSRRAALAAFLVGAAVAAKPTAVFLVAPPVAIALAVSIPPRRWPTAALATIPCGLVHLVPHLVRNHLHSGNPVFPAASSLFTRAHWSADQLSRWNTAHHPAISLSTRLARLLTTGGDGLLHHQFSLLFPLAAIAAVVALARAHTRRPALLALAILGAQLIAWLSLGHLQSRFLIPATIPACLLIALAAAHTQTPALRARDLLGRALPLVTVAALLTSSILIFLRQNDGAPAAALIPGVPYLNASLLDQSPPPLSDPGARDFYLNHPPAVAINNLARITGTPDPTVLLVGDATPLYLGRPPTRILYATTWDSNPLAEALRASPSDPAAALARLRDSHHVTHLLINLAELDRLHRSGYLDPLLAPDSILALARTHTRTLLEWPTPGVLLVELP